MNDERFPSNSYSSRLQKSEKPVGKAEPVAKGHISRQPKTLGAKIREIFPRTDVKDICEDVIRNILLPGISDTAYNFGEGILRTIFYGSSSRKLGRNTIDRRRNYTSYGSISDKRDRGEREVRKSNIGSIGEDIIFNTRQDALDVLNQMFQHIDDYDLVTVKELYNFSGLDSDYTKEKYGWESLDGADAVRVPEGWGLKLPKPKIIDN